MNDQEDDASGGRWATYSEIGVARGISRTSAERLARKKRWRRQPGNDGHARVLVPLGWLARERATPPDQPPADPRGALAVLRDALASLDVSLGRERSRADRAEAEVAALRQAEAVRRGRGRLSRLRAAWRGE